SAFVHRLMCLMFLLLLRLPGSTLFPYTTLFRSGWPLLIMGLIGFWVVYWYAGTPLPLSRTPFGELASGLTMGYLIFLSATYVNIDRKSTRLNSSHVSMSYAVFCLKKKNRTNTRK